MTDIDIAKPGPLMAGKRGLVMGVANDRSIAWGIARVLAGQGAELAFTYQGGAFGRRAVPLAQSLGSKIIEECNVLDLPSVDNVFNRIKAGVGQPRLRRACAGLFRSARARRPLRRHHPRQLHQFDGDLVLLLHRDRQARRRPDAEWRLADHALLRRRDPVGAVLQRHGRCQGGARSVRPLSRRRPRSRKASASTRFRQAPMRTLSGAGVSDARVIFNFSAITRRLKRTPTLDEVGGSALYLLSPLSGAVTGEVHFVDCGYNTVRCRRSELERARCREQGPEQISVRSGGVTSEGVDVRRRASQTLGP